MDRTRTASWSAFLVGLIAGPIATLLLVVAAGIHASISGWGYAVGAALTAAGLLSMPWRRRRGVTRAGLGLVLLVATARLLFAGGDRMDTLRLPSGDERLVNRIVEERDGTLLAAHLLLFTGQLPRSDARDFIPALARTFDQLEADKGSFTTPAVATWLGLQSSDDFDTVVIPPEGPKSPDTAVVALHGFTGNFAVYCWQLSRAARAISALTVCPSVGPLGDWWSPQGEKTLERTLTWLERRGIHRVYLSGLSNGGVGASVLAARLAHSRLELRGLVLISGASRVADTPRVPALLIQGRHDSMFPARRMRAFAERTGKLATYFEVDSGHFAFLDHADECERAIASWLREREMDTHGRITPVPSN